MSSDDYFILQAFDPNQLCPVLQTRFKVPDIAVLRTVLGAEADGDPDLRHSYWLDEADLAAVIAVFGVPFDPVPLGASHSVVLLFRMHSIQTAPYLIHTGYELPLLLDGRKKLAKMYDYYPPMTFEGEHRFDHWVEQGVLHRVEVLEPFDPPIKGYTGNRIVYYTPKGEEWRIRAMQFIWHASGKAGGWNEYFERLEGMLFGYEDWQNDWWIETGLRGGGIGGARLCCAVTEDGLAWLEAAGFRALPPCGKPALTVTLYDADDSTKMRALLREDDDSVALVRFLVPPRRARDLLPIPPDSDGRWLVPSHLIPELNRHLRNTVVVAMRRDDPA